ncbi:hypothetical protein GGI15_002783 [Coemansia interrupta]|uniref:Uncharacterized protein n=1 Tax=Coemansia interrupta TaxID=1126814 RepID=A0A9W8LJR5_9FUNG|nr:hypothetical protein GGI15_002783 [Coemansia interrupta]
MCLRSCPLRRHGTETEQLEPRAESLQLFYSQWVCPNCSEVSKDEAEYLAHLTKCITV